MKLVYTERALADLDLAIEWYEKQRRGLGFEFLNCVEVTIHRILENPQVYSIKLKNLRAALTRRFPFSVFYEISENEIVIHALFDNRRDPKNRP